jgi:hypothetical protein
MEAVKETSKTPVLVPFTVAVTRQIADRTSALAPSSGGQKPDLEIRRGQEIIAWIAMAVIWGLSALSVYLIWIKAGSSI